MVTQQYFDIYHAFVHHGCTWAKYFEPLWPRLCQKGQKELLASIKGMCGADQDRVWVLRPNMPPDQELVEFFDLFPGDEELTHHIKAHQYRQALAVPQDFSPLQVKTIPFIHFRYFFTNSEWAPNAIDQLPNLLLTQKQILGTIPVGRPLTPDERRLVQQLSYKNLHPR